MNKSSQAGDPNHQAFIKMSKKMISGVCRICGKKKMLSFEHTPPKAAFNNSPVVTIRLEQLIALGPDVKPKGPIKQRGMGDYVLCEDCNNNSGLWYAPRFVDWCYRGMEILKLSNGNPNLVYTYKIYPLSVIKQIIVMLLAVNQPEFTQAYQDLATLVMNKIENGLPSQYRIFTYYNTVGLHRNIGLSGKIDLINSKATLMSEISFPPFGYLLTVNSDKPDERLLDISDFANYGYDDIAEIQIKMATLPTHLLYPGDYRSKAEILKARESNIANNIS